METLTNIASATSKTIWGDGNSQSGVEPVSGKAGPGTADEPYDAGNSAGSSGTSGELDKSSTAATTEQETLRTTDESSTTAKKSSVDPTTSTTSDTTALPSKPSDAGDGIANRTTSGQRPEGLSSAHSEGPKGSTATDPPLSPQPLESPGVAIKIEKKSSADSHPLVDEEPKIKKRDPNDHSGEPIKMHDDSEKEAKPSSETKSAEHEKAHVGKGTGEKYVKSTGFAAEGGDFDASRPGAGAEADRLLEQKGMRPSHGPPTSGGSAPREYSAPTPPQDHVSDKHGLSKLKEKLHISK